MLKLFNIWNNRIAAQAIEAAMKDIQKMVEDCKVRIKPLCGKWRPTGDLNPEPHGS